MDALLVDLKYALRSIASAKKLASIVISTLALGIGANTAVFGVLHAVVLKPLPYEEPDRLVRIYHFSGTSSEYLPGPEVFGYRDGSRSLDVAALYTYTAEGADLTDGPEPERVRTLSVSAAYFRVLGAHPVLGQVFERTDERRDARVVVVSERIWRKHLGSDARAVGRPLTLDGIAYRVAAVLPDGFDDPLESGIDVWMPLNMEPGRSNGWNNFYLSAIGRLKPGTTIEQAQAELASIAAGLRTESGSRTPWSARVLPLQIDTVGSARTTLWILLGAVAMLLVIACVNVASLMLARGSARQAELAVRSALGCSSARLVRQLLIESLLLSAGGGAAGLLLARAATGALLAAAPAAVSRAGSGGTIERAVFAFSAAIAVLAGLAFGAAPAMQGARPDLDAVLRDSGRSGSGSRRQTRARNALVVCQVALALVLLVGAGLLLRSFERLQSVDVGVRPSHVLTFTVSLPSGRYNDPEQRARFYRDFLARLGAIPGVRSAAAISRLPVTGTYHNWGVDRGDRPPARGALMAQQRVIEGPYFDAVGIPILRGRTFDARDDARAPRRVVISQELGRLLYPGEDPVGKVLDVNEAHTEIIGVVGDVALGARLPARPYVYHSHSQFASDRNWALTEVVKFDSERPSHVPSLIDAARRELSQIDPALVLYQPQMLDEVIGGGVAQERFALQLIAAFALLALALAAVGIYGVLSYAVSRRRREMGIRMALGAPAATVRSMVVRDGGRLAVAGIIFGAAGAIGATRFLQSLLFGVSATEPAVFAAAAAVLASVALAASWIPARTATRVDPLEAVRD